MSKYLDGNDIENDYELLNKENKLITGDGGGCGKTHENTMEYINSPLESRFLNPTHIANKNINDKLVEIGCKENMLVRQNRIDVIASIFTKGKSVNEMLNGLKDVKQVHIDEFYQLSPFQIYLLYLASTMFGVKLIVSGDVLQVPSPDEKSVYNLRINDFIHVMLFNNKKHLNYNPKSCRFTDNLPDLLHELLSTKRIPSYFKDKVFNKKELPFDFYLCLKCDDATIISKNISIRECKNTKALYSNGYGYCKYMPLVSMENTTIDKFSYCKTFFERYRLSLMYQIFCSWRYEKYTTIKITHKFNCKHEIHQCNLLNYISELPKNKQMENNIKKYQKQYNYLLCIVKSTFTAFKTNWARSKEKQWKINNKFNYSWKPYPEGYKIHNKQEFEIKEIDDAKNLITLTTGETLHVKTIDKYFQPNYARTIDSFQGDKITQPYGIVGIKHQHFTLERLNSAIGKARCKDLIHVDFYDENKIFQSKEYPHQVIINTELKTDDYSKIWFYSVWYKAIKEYPMYIGSTSQTIEERMEQHYNDKANDKFHKWLRNTPRDDVVVCPIYDVDVEINNLFNEPMVFENWGQIEDFEMNLVQKYNPLLNTRRQTQRQETIKITEQQLTNTMTVEEFNKIKYYEKEEKEITPIFTDMKSIKICRLRYSHNGERKEFKKGYAKIGYEKAKEHLENRFNEELQKIKIKELNNENKPTEIDDDEYDDKLWIEPSMNDEHADEHNDDDDDELINTYIPEIYLMSNEDIEQVKTHDKLNYVKSLELITKQYK